MTPAPSPSPAQHPAFFDAAAVVAVVAAEFGVTVDALKAYDNTRRISQARQAAYAALRGAGLSLPRIGQRLGGRDHTSVRTGIERCFRNAATDPLYAAKVAKCCKAAAQ